jgi:hypothetical protein
VKLDVVTLGGLDVSVRYAPAPCSDSDSEVDAEAPEGWLARWFGGYGALRGGGGKQTGAQNEEFPCDDKRLENIDNIEDAHVWQIANHRDYMSSDALREAVKRVHSEKLFAFIPKKKFLNAEWNDSDIMVGVQGPNGLITTEALKGMKRDPKLCSEFYSVCLQTVDFK